MKLFEVQDEAMLVELRNGVREVLSESIVEYFSTVLANLKSKDSSALFNQDAPLVKIDQLASLVAGLKVLSDFEQRQNLTKDEIRINPNNSMQLFNLLNSIPKNGKGTPKLTLDVFNALAKVAPKTFKSELERLKGLKKDSTRKQLTAELDKFSEKVSVMFKKVKAIAHGDEE